MSHYLTKAFVVNYLVSRLTEEFKGEGAKEDEARRKALGRVSTEHQPGGANVRLVEVARRLLDEWRGLKGEPAGGAEEGVTSDQ